MDPIVAAFFKKSVVAAPGGQPAPPPAPPMDPAMMGGMPPMDPAMMQGGMPPMDPAMMQGGMPPGPPMDPAMMGGMPPAPMNIEQEIVQIKDMLQQLMDAQIAMMQALAPGGMPMPPAPPMDPAMMQGGMPPAPPAPPGMTVTASDNSDEQDLNSFIKSISSLLR